MRIQTFVLFLVLVPFQALAVEFTLDQAYRSALEKNERVRQSGEQLIQAEERVSRVRGNLFPELSFNAVHLIQPLPDDPIAREFSPAQQTTANFTVAQPIFHGLREFAGLRQQSQYRVAQEAIKRHSMQQLYQEVATSYLNVLTLEQDLRNLEDQVEIYENRVKELKGRTRRGESSATELLSTQSTQNSLQAELRLVQGQLKVARENFFSLTGKPRDSKLVDPGLLPKAGNTIKKSAVKDLTDYLARKERRPDVQAALAQNEAADEGIAVARGGHFPALDALGNYYIKRPGFLEDLKWDVSFRLSFPLFSGGSTQAQVREAVSKNKEAQLELARVRRIADEEIRSLHETLLARIEHLSFLRQSSELAEKNITVSQKEFRRGLIRSIDVQQALGEYRIVRRSFDQAHYAAQLDLLKLEVASGLKPEGLFNNSQRGSSQ